jgi:hypothetical protein
MPARTELNWTDLSPAAHEVFHIWTDRHAEELRGASSAWTALQKAGLTSYSGEVEKALVLIRLMTLAAMYHEFGDRAWQEYFTPDYVDWAEQLEIDEIQVDELLGPDELRDSVDHSLFGERLRFLVNLSRREIYKALVAYFGDGSGIFTALWKIQEPEEEEYFILNEVTSDKMAAFDWVNQGMKELHQEGRFRRFVGDTLRLASSTMN